MLQKTKVTRFSVLLPPPLVEKLDEVWKSSYENRSKAIHDACKRLYQLILVDADGGGGE